MRLSTSTNIYFNRPDGSKADLCRSIELCADAGYRVMDMNFHDCVTFKNCFTAPEREYRSWLDGIRAQAAIFKMEFSQSHAPFYNFCDDALDPELRTRMDMLINRSIEAAAELGIPWIVIHAGTDYSSARMRADSRRKNLARLAPFAEKAKLAGTGLAIENLWDLDISPKQRYTANAEELVDLVDALNLRLGSGSDPAVGICWDFEHADIMGQDQASALALVGDRLKATHVSDHTGKSNDHILPFDGVIDWKSLMPVIGALDDYRGDFTFEIHRYTAKLDDLLVPGALRRSVEVGEHLLALAGHAAARPRRER